MFRNPTTLRLARSCAVAVLFSTPTLFAQPAARPASDTVRLTLGDAVSIALRQSDEVALSQALVDVADAQFGQARANTLPQLRFSGSYLKVYESARGQAVGSVFNQPNTYIGSLNLSQTVFQGGRLLNSMRAADETRQAARFDEREQRSMLTVSVQRAYLQALFTDRLALLQERNLALASSRLTQVEQFEKGGRAARYDVLRSRVERANIEPLAIQARSDRELALLELRRVLNIPVEQPVALVTRIDSASVAAMLAQLDTAGTVDRAVVRSAELNLASKQLGVKVARADFYPVVSVFYQQGLQAFPLAGVPTSIGNLTIDACPVGTVAGKTLPERWILRRPTGGHTSAFPCSTDFA